MAKARLDGKVCIVTGGASGFGKAIASRFLQEGGKVVIADVNDEAGKAVASELGCAFVKADISIKQGWTDIRDKALELHGQLDIVVNNAGAAYQSKPTEQVSEAEFDMVFNVNVKSLFLSTAVLLPYFLSEKRAGCFIQVASTGGIRPRPKLTWYNASKGCVITATKSLASEYAASRIRFNAVSPVFSASTGMSQLFIAEGSTAAPFVATVPLGRTAEPADVANAVSFLASDEASFLTGVNLEVDGGRCI